MKLSTDQIHALDEIYTDEKSAEATMRVALAFHHNCLNDIHKRECKFWEDLAEIHGLDLSIKYTIKRENGFSIIVEASND